MEGEKRLGGEREQAGWGREEAGWGERRGGVGVTVVDEGDGVRGVRKRSKRARKVDKNRILLYSDFAKVTRGGRCIVCVCVCI